MKPTRAVPSYGVEIDPETGMPVLSAGQRWFLRKPRWQNDYHKVEVQEKRLGVWITFHEQAVGHLDAVAGDITDQDILDGACYLSWFYSDEQVAVRNREAIEREMRLGAYPPNKLGPGRGL